MERTKFLIVDLDPFGARLKNVTERAVVQEYGSLINRVQPTGFQKLCESLQAWLVREMLEVIYLVQVRNHARDEYYDFEQQVRDLYPLYENDFTACFQPYFKSLTQLPDFAIVKYEGHNLIIIDDSSKSHTQNRIINFLSRKKT